MSGRFNSPAVIALGRFAAMGLALIATPVIARTLGPEGRGVTASILAVLAVLPVAAGLGVPLAVRRRVSSGTSPTDVVRTARRYALLSAAPTAVIAIGAHLALFGAIGPAATVAYVVAAATIPAAVSWDIDANVLIARGQYSRMAAMAVTQSAVSTTVIVVAWILGFLGIPTVIYATAAGNLTTFIVGRWWVREGSGRASGMGDLAREGTTMVGGVLADASARKVDQMVALPILGAGGAGLYSVAVTVGTLVTPVVQALGNAAFRDLTTATKNETTAVIRRGVALAVLAAAGIAVLGWVGIPIVFGTDFTDSRLVAAIVAAGAIPSSAGFVAAMALAAQGHGRSMSAAQVISVAVGIALMTPLAHVWGSAGAALAMALGSTAGLFVSLAMLRVNPVRIIPMPGDFPAALSALFRSERGSGATSPDPHAG